MQVGSVTAITPQILVEACGRHGVSKEKLLDGAGIPHEAIHSPSGRVPVEAMCALWENALRLTKEPMLALHAAERVPFGAYRLLDYMLAASANPKEGLIRSTRSFGVMNNAFTLVFRLHQDRAYLELHGRSASESPSRPYIEYILTLYIARLCFVTQGDCKPAEVLVKYSRPRFADEYERAFGARVRFNQPINGLVFDRHSMERPQPLADAELCEVLEGYAQRGSTRAVEEKHLLQEIRHALAYSLANARATLSHVSAQLGMSSRTLQRRILENGRTFRDLLDDVRQDRAPLLLRDQEISIKEIASRLQFSDASSFSHAFYRWTGSTPTGYRKKLQLLSSESE